MATKSKEGLSGLLDTASEVLGDTKTSLSLLEKETRIGFFKKASDWLKSLFWSTGTETQTSHRTETRQKEKIQQGGTQISENMFQELLKMEGSQNFVAKSHRSKFGESFVTGPYGMVYKHIDKNGNLLKTPLPFKEGERVDKKRAENNARAYYNKRAKEWSDLLKSKGYKYSQDMLDALVCASGGTTRSQNRLKNYVISHRGNEDAIYNFMSKFATTAAGNGKVMPGLVRRRKFEANWFKGNKQPFQTYRA